MNSPIRVLIVDDHEIVRKGIRALLATKRDIVLASNVNNFSVRAVANIDQGV